VRDSGDLRWDESLATVLLIDAASSKGRSPHINPIAFPIFKQFARAIWKRCVSLKFAGIKQLMNDFSAVVTSQSLFVLLLQLRNKFFFLPPDYSISCNDCVQAY
jgi:hypothetical protein